MYFKSFCVTFSCCIFVLLKSVFPTLHVRQLYWSEYVLYCGKIYITILGYVSSTTEIHHLILSVHDVKSCP
jgi:hypothetical protein